MPPSLLYNFLNRKKHQHQRRAFEPFLPGTQLPEELLSPQSVASIPQSTMTQQGSKGVQGSPAARPLVPALPRHEDARGGAEQDLQLGAG